MYYCRHAQCRYLPKIDIGQMFIISYLKHLCDINYNFKQVLKTLYNYTSMVHFAYVSPPCIKHSLTSFCQWYQEDTGKFDVDVMPQLFLDISLPFRIANICRYITAKPILHCGFIVTMLNVY